MKTPFNVGHFWTTNIEVAACLFGLGFKLRRENPITRIIDGNRQTDTFWFNEDCANGDFGPVSAKLILEIWKGENNSPAPEGLARVIDYIRTAAENRRLMLAAIKQHVNPLVVHHIDGRDVFLPLDASPELQAKMKRMIAETA